MGLRLVAKSVRNQSCDRERGLRRGDTWAKCQVVAAQNDIIDQLEGFQVMREINLRILRNHTRQKLPPEYMANI